MTPDRHVPWLTVAALWTAALLYLSLTPAPPQIEGPLGWDKLQHALALGLMDFFVAQTCLRLHMSLKGSLITGFGTAVAVGGMIEILQGWLPVNRQADLLDFAADAAGAVCTTVFLGIAKGLRRNHW